MRLVSDVIVVVLPMYALRGRSAQSPRVHSFVVIYDVCLFENGCILGHVVFQN